MKIKAIVKRPDEQVGHVCYVSDALENLQKTVGGYIEALQLGDGLFLICNEEGRLKNLEKNFVITNGGFQIQIVGTVLIVGSDGESFSDVPISKTKWQSMLKEWGN